MTLSFNLGNKHWPLCWRSYFSLQLSWQGYVAGLQTRGAIIRSLSLLNRNLCLKRTGILCTSTGAGDLRQCNLHASSRFQFSFGLELSSPVGIFCCERQSKLPPNN